MKQGSQERHIYTKQNGTQAIPLYIVYVVEERERKIYVRLTCDARRLHFRPSFDPLADQWWELRILAANGYCMAHSSVYKYDGLMSDEWWEKN